ncbi:MAG: hypothetical protein AAF799_04880 [Myxococcota bacterium]
MTKIKPLALLVSLTAVTMLSACNLDFLDTLRPGSDELCADIGDGHCPLPHPPGTREP